MRLALNHDPLEVLEAARAHELEVKKMVRVLS
jgi:hypothetical protein